MNKQLAKDLLDKLPKNGEIVIFGAGEIASKMYDDIKMYRNDVNILGFIECKMSKSSFLNLPVWGLKEFIDKNLKVDYVVFSTVVDIGYVTSILDIYDIPVILQSAHLYHYYRNNLEMLKDDDYETIISILETQEDKDLFELLFKIRTCVLPWNDTEKHYNKLVENCNRDSYNNIRFQYLDKINKEAVTKIFDIGMNNGLNVVAFNKLLPNLQKTYGFEVVYDHARKDYIDDFICNDKLEVVPVALGKENKTINFLINKKYDAMSLCEELTSKYGYNKEDMIKIQVPLTTIDTYCEQNKVTPDFIKMDIEGAEMPALQGGIEYIKKNRPQLAISIYHSNEDFINIPKYLNDNLKDYTFRLGHYTSGSAETIFYAIPNELV